MGGLESKIKTAIRSKATSLDLGMTGLGKTEGLPKEIGLIVSLKKLDLGGNMLTSGSFPTSMSALTQLQILRLCSNQLASIPPVVCLKSLTHLDLMFNNIRRIGPELENLRNLIVLNLHGNLLKSLPPTIGQLTKLQELDLASNKIQSFPVEIGDLVSLKKLWWVGNPLEGTDCMPRSWMKFGLGRKWSLNLKELRIYLTRVNVSYNGGKADSSSVHLSLGSIHSFQEDDEAINVERRVQSHKLSRRDLEKTLPSKAQVQSWLVEAKLAAEVSDDESETDSLLPPPFERSMTY